MAAKKKPTAKPKHRTPRPDLSAREVRFCRMYTELGNATEAAGQAGFVSTDRVSMASRASALLRKSQIRGLIRRMQQEATDAEQITVNRLAQSFGRAAFADRTKIFDAKGRVKPPHLWPEELRAIVTGFDVEEETAATFDPTTGEPVGVTTVKYKVRFRPGTEEGKVLARWRGMIDGDAPGGAATPSRVIVTVEDAGDA